MTYSRMPPTGIPQANVANLPTDLAAKAASTEAFVVIGAAAGLTSERALTAGAGISITDAGAGSTVTIAATGGGSVSATTVEQNLGSRPVWSGSFTVTDAAIGATSKVLCWQAPGPYTGKGTRADEAELQPVSVIAVEPSAGSAVVKWQTPPMLSESPVATIGANTVLAGATARNRDYQPVAQRIGKVRGNVKFSYVVFA